MTDTSSLVDNHVGITSDLQFHLKPSAVRSRSYRASILPTNGNTAACGATSILYVPGGRRNSYLDCSQSYIKFTVNNNDTAPINFDSHGCSVINRLDVFHGSNLLETLQGYNNLVTYCLDMNLTVAQRIGLSTAYGFDNAGLRAGQSIPAGGARTICMPIFSAIVGLGSSKMIPIGMMCDDIRLEVSWEAALLGMVYQSAVVATTGTAFTAGSLAAGTSAAVAATNYVPATIAAAVGVLAPWSISGIELELCIIELSDEGENMVRSESPPEHPIYIAGNSWRHYVSSYVCSAGMSSFIVPARFASLRSMVILPHRNIDQQAFAYSQASRVNPNIASMYLRIGSSLVPAKPIFLENGSAIPFTVAGSAEPFMELQRSWHSLNNACNASGLTSLIYNVRDTTLAGTPWVGVAAVGLPATTLSYNNGFAMHLELSTFANRDDCLFSGYNSLTQQIFLEFNVNTAATVSPTYTFDYFANYDHVLILEHGLLSVRF